MRHRWLIRAVGGATVLLVLFAPAAEAVQSDTLAVGDSVMLGARWALQKRGIAVDAKVSRQARTGPGLLRAKGSRLPRNVVVHLGTNGPMRLADCQDVIRAAGPQRRVFLVTVKADRRWIAGNNQTLRHCASGFPGRVSIIDWAWAARRHPAWLYADGIHLRPAGARAFARLVDDAVNGPATPARTP